MRNDYTKGKLAEHADLLLHVDGGCEPKNPGGVATAGWVFYDTKKPKEPLAEEGTVVRDGGELSTNNYGEYCALALALKFLIEQKWAGTLTVKADSKLLVHQVKGEWKCNKEHLSEVRDTIWARMGKLNLHIVTTDEPLPPEGKTACNLLWVRRNLNEHANDLCRAAYQEYKAK